MLIDLLGRLSDSNLVSNRKKLELIVTDLRKVYLDEGGDLQKFPEYLEKQGIRASNGFITVDEKWDTYVALKV